MGGAGGGPVGAAEGRGRLPGPVRQRDGGAAPSPDGGAAAHPPSVPALCGHTEGTERRRSHENHAWPGGMMYYYYCYYSPGEMY